MVSAGELSIARNINPCDAAHLLESREIQSLEADPTRPLEVLDQTLVLRIERDTACGSKRPVAKKVREDLQPSTLTRVERATFAQQTQFWWRRDEVAFRKIT